MTFNSEEPYKAIITPTIMLKPNEAAAHVLPWPGEQRKDGEGAFGRRPLRNFTLGLAVTLSDL